MPLPIRAEEIGPRSRDYPLNDYLFIGNVTKGIALSVATIVLLQIAVHFFSAWPLLGPWFASVMAILITHTTWGRGILVTNARANAWDSFFPLCMGIVEFLLFAVLIVKADVLGLPSDNTGIQYSLLWFYVLSVHGLLAVLLTTNRIRNSHVLADFEPDLRYLGTDIENWIRGDRLGASLLAAIAGLAAIAVTLYARHYGCTNAKIAQGIAAGIFGLFMILIVHQASQQRRYIDAYISIVLAYREETKQKNAPQTLHECSQGEDKDPFAKAVELALEDDKRKQRKDRILFYCLLAFVLTLIAAAGIFLWHEIQAFGIGPGAKC